MRPVPGAILAFIVAFVAIYIVVVTVGHALMQGVSDPGGNRALQIAFQIGPLCATAGGIVAAIVAGRRLARGRTGTAGDPPATKPQPPAVRGAILVLIAIGLGYALARVLFGLP